MMPRFQTVGLCFDCWNRFQPDKQVAKDDPRRDNQGPIEVCFGCGQVTHSGVYVRLDTMRTLEDQR